MLRGYIYCIRNKINGKLYVGRTNNYKRRYNEHFGNKDSCTILRRAFEKYGKENFKMYPIITFTASNSQVLDEILNYLEKKYILKYNTYKNGYNATFGGDGNCGWKPSATTLIRRSASLRGRKVSDKEKERLRSYALNRVWTQEQKEHQRQNMLNRDPEIRKRIGEKLRGRKRNPEMIRKAAAKRRKPILQYSLEGDFIKEYPCATLIPNCSDSNIIACCKGKINSAYGYVWRYKIGNAFCSKIEGANNYHQANKPIIQYDRGENFIAEYKSATEASMKTNIGRMAITNCLMHRSKSAGGYIWKYKNIRREVA